MVVASGSGSTKEERAVKVRKIKSCNDPSCSKNPYFGWPGEKAVYCVTHKTKGESAAVARDVSLTTFARCVAEGAGYIHQCRNLPSPFLHGS